MRESALRNNDRSLRSVMNELRLHGWSWKSGGAVFGLCGGIISPVIGSIFTAIAWFSGPTWHGFAMQRDGTVLLFLTIPLLIFGAHCLDLVERQQRRDKQGLNN
jgi:hypothetical protein